MSFGLPIISYGMIYKTYLVAVVGGLIMLAGLYAWALEPSAEPHHPEDDDHGVESELEREDAALVTAGAPALGLEAGAAEPAVATDESTEG